jgi:hypothetical protein
MIPRGLHRFISVVIDTTHGIKYCGLSLVVRSGKHGDCLRYVALRDGWKCRVSGIETLSQFPVDKATAIALILDTSKCRSGCYLETLSCQET